VQTAYDVPDVRTYYHDAKLAVIPLLTGGGTRMKMVEAFAIGTPVVATPIGAEGVEAEPGRDFVMADGSDAQAKAILELLDDRDRRRKIAASARIVAVEKYSWDSAAETLISVLKEAARGD